jgi:hypothetical protein
MAAVDEVVPRDDRAWPRGALLLSPVLVLVAAGVGIGLVLDAAERGSLIMLAVLAGWRLGALAALALVVYWLA